ncbi:MAG: hypothetical protein ACI89X_002391 [Planctomycetota bacterium]|jgi:hypothetical protein
MSGLPASMDNGTAGRIDVRYKPRRLSNLAQMTGPRRVGAQNTAGLGGGFPPNTVSRLGDLIPA